MLKSHLSYGGGGGGVSHRTGGARRYCLCRLTEEQLAAFEFEMVKCDMCNEWYHGECIGIFVEDIPKKESFYCGNCRPDTHPFGAPREYSPLRLIETGRYTPGDTLSNELSNEITRAKKADLRDRKKQQRGQQGGAKKAKGAGRAAAARSSQRDARSASSTDEDDSSGSSSSDTGSDSDGESDSSVSSSSLSESEDDTDISTDDENDDDGVEALKAQQPGDEPLVARRPRRAIKVPERFLENAENQEQLQTRERRKKTSSSAGGSGSSGGGTSSSSSISASGNVGGKSRKTSSTSAHNASTGAASNKTAPNAAVSTKSKLANEALAKQIAETRARAVTRITTLLEQREQEDMERCAPELKAAIEAHEVEKKALAETELTKQSELEAGVPKLRLYAAAVEAALFQFHAPPGATSYTPLPSSYRERLMAIVTALSDEGNYELRIRARSGLLPPARLAGMSDAELASPELERIRRENEIEAMRDRLRIDEDDPNAVRRVMEALDQGRVDLLIKPDEDKKESAKDDSDSMSDADSDTSTTSSGTSRSSRMDGTTTDSDTDSSTDSTTDGSETDATDPDAVSDTDSTGAASVAGDVSTDDEDGRRARKKTHSSTGLGTKRSNKRADEGHTDVKRTRKDEAETKSGEATTVGSLSLSTRTHAWGGPKLGLGASDDIEVDLGDLGDAGDADENVTATPTVAPASPPRGAATPPALASAASPQNTTTTLEPSATLTSTSQGTVAASEASKPAPVKPELTSPKLPDYCSERMADECLVAWETRMTVINSPNPVSMQLRIHAPAAAFANLPSPAQLTSRLSAAPSKADLDVAESLATLPPVSQMSGLLSVSAVTKYIVSLVRSTSRRTIAAFTVLPGAANDLPALQALAAHLVERGNAAVLDLQETVGILLYFFPDVNVGEPLSSGTAVDGLVPPQRIVDARASQSVLLKTCIQHGVPVYAPPIALSAETAFGRSADMHSRSPLWGIAIVIPKKQAQPLPAAPLARPAGPPPLPLAQPAPPIPPSSGPVPIAPGMPPGGASMGYPPASDWMTPGPTSMPMPGTSPAPDFATGSMMAAPGLAPPSMPSDHLASSSAAPEVALNEKDLAALLSTLAGGALSGVVPQAGAPAEPAAYDPYQPGGYGAAGGAPPPPHTGGTSSSYGPGYSAPAHQDMYSPYPPSGASDYPAHPTPSVDHTQLPFQPVPSQQHPPPPPPPSGASSASGSAGGSSRAFIHADRLQGLGLSDRDRNGYSSERGGYGNRGGYGDRYSDRYSDRYGGDRDNYASDRGYSERGYGSDRGGYGGDRATYGDRDRGGHAADRGGYSADRGGPGGGYASGDRGAYSYGDRGDRQGGQGGAQRGPRGDRPLPPNYRTVPCRYFNTPQGCPFGDRCTYKH